METSSESPTTIQVAKSAGSVGIAVFSSRILGLIREQVMAVLFGAGYYMDAFVVAFRMPNLLRDLLAKGPFRPPLSRFLPITIKRKDRRQTWRLANNVLSALTVFLSLITLLGIIFSEQIIRIMAADFDRVQGKIALTQLLTNIMFPFLILISTAAVVMGILNTKGRFFVPAMASAFFNFGSIVGGVLCAWWAPSFGQPRIVGMAVGTLIGGFLQLAVQIPSLKGCGFKWRPHLNLKDEGLHRIMVLMIPAVIGLSATQINIFINTNFAARCAQGSVSWLNYAFRLMQFPIGIFGVAISIATLPVISRQASSGDLGSLKSTYVSSLTMAFLLTVPASFGLAFLAKPIIRLIFEHGRFNAHRYPAYGRGPGLLFYRAFRLCFDQDYRAGFLCPPGHQISRHGQFFSGHQQHHLYFPDHRQISAQGHCLFHFHHHDPEFCFSERRPLSQSRRIRPEISLQVFDQDRPGLPHYGDRRFLSLPGSRITPRPKKIDE